MTDTTYEEFTHLRDKRKAEEALINKLKHEQRTLHFRMDEATSEVGALTEKMKTLAVEWWTAYLSLTPGKTHIHYGANLQEEGIFEGVSRSCAAPTLYPSCKPCIHVRSLDCEELIKVETHWKAREVPSLEKVKELYEESDRLTEEWRALRETKANIINKANDAASEWWEHHLGLVPNVTRIRDLDASPDKHLTYREVDRGHIRPTLDSSILPNIVAMDVTGKEGIITMWEKWDAR